MTATTSEETTCARIAQQLAQAVGPHRYKVWFDRAVRLDYQERDGRLIVAVPNRFFADWIGRHFQLDLERAALSATGRATVLDLRVDPVPFTHAAAASAAGFRPQPAAAPRAASGSGAAPWDRAASPVASAPSYPLRYRLEDFVVGPSNELAYAAAARLAEDDHAANPLFIHGGVGLGKTHLLQGVCRRLGEQRPEARVLYTTGEQFTNEFLTAIRANKLDAFRRRVRRLDLLAIDDVHFLANKEKTQQEFLHSFDAIELSGARVVLASDSHPKLIAQFSEALVSRCVRGLVVEVRQPDTATRVKIIRALAQRRGISLLETVVAALAVRCQGSVREIEGTLTRLQALSQLAGPGRLEAGLAGPDEPMAAPTTGAHASVLVDDSGDAATLTVSNAPLLAASQPVCATPLAEALVASDSAAARPRIAAAAPTPIGHALVNRLFGAEFQSPRPQTVRLEAILAAVCRRLGVTRAQIISGGRQRPLVLARSLVIHLARRLTPLSFPEIAAALSKASHSTIISADQRIQSQVAAGAVVVVSPAPENGVSGASEEVALADLIDQLQRDILKN